jgi:hypothetical protein
MFIHHHRRIFVSDGNVGRIPFWSLDGRVCLLPYCYLGFGVGIGEGEAGSFNGISSESGQGNFKQIGIHSIISMLSILCPLKLLLRSTATPRRRHTQL